MGNRGMINILGFLLDLSVKGQFFLHGIAAKPSMELWNCGENLRAPELISEISSKNWNWSGFHQYFYTLYQVALGWIV